MPFKIVKTIDKGKFLLSIVPSKWEQNGTLFWPKKNVDILRQCDQSEPDDNWLTYGCILKKTSLVNYQKAEYELARIKIQMETDSNNDRGDSFSQNKKSRLQQVLDDSENECSTTGYIRISKSEYHELHDPQNQLVDLEDPSDTSNIQQNNSSRIDSVLTKLNKLIESNKKICENIKNLQEQLNLLQEGQTTMLYNMNHSNFNSDLLFDSRPIAKLSIDVGLIKNLEDFEKFENLLKEPETEKQLMGKYSVICGVGKGRGVNNAYELIDALFDRDFLPKCSWAGGSRTGESKICFKVYTNVINFFFNLVHMSDTSYTLTDCHDFLKMILRNSRQRCQSKNMRKSSTKNRRRIKQVNDNTDPLDATGDSPQPESCLEQTEDQTNQSTDEDI